MTPFLFFASIFLFVLINTYFFTSPKFFSWLSSLLLKCFHVVKQTKKKQKKGNEIPVLIVEKTELETMFSTFDKDGDGFITMQELEESLRKLGLFSTEKELVSMIDRVDANRDGLIDLDEFQKLYESIVKGNSNGDDDGDDEDQKEMDLKEAFDVFDGNRDGLITVDELGLVLSSLGLGRRVEDYKEMIKKVDLDGDGMVNFDEFKRMMMPNNVGKLL
ncbi:Calmodulin and related proteins (EF-Hand superfamily) protein [Dioscorea alata]|uniref:Calmodulin and related proteins (EF-Hand superfamily) protein n=1 Tax=Dioscorea alata TaxID=55571 RepID=A0ACB7WKS1_DIOAL|nr:Calmodulin and related proteins (EF-Hand superfamily) protein [Dioscorea alata]